MPNIYLDVCCLNWPFDDQSQARIRLEAEAVRLIIARLGFNDWVGVGSPAIVFELDRIRDPEPRVCVRLLTDAISRWAPLDQIRAAEVVAFGFRALDVLHLAAAESDGADVFLTTDDRLLIRAQQRSSELRLEVSNPVAWLERQQRNEEQN